MDGCSISTQICSSPEQTALKKMIEQLCATRQAYDIYKSCLRSVVSSQQGTSCMSKFMSSSQLNQCSTIQYVATCMARQVRDSCGDDALTYTFAAMNDYAQMIDKQCVIDKPVVSIATGCSEQDMITYLSSGQKCISGMASIDPIAADAPKKMCEALNSILTCAGNDIEKECGYDALLHVYEQHIQWAQAYNKSCVIQSPEPRSVSANTLDKSRDVEPLHVVRDETTPYSVPQKDPTPTVLTSDSETSPTSPTIVTTTSSEQPMTTTHQEDATAAGKGEVDNLSQLKEQVEAYGLVVNDLDFSLHIIEFYATMTESPTMIAP
uniref:DUF725 domain-containing protein n=1 Tax=Angiostrongylus cantonensis TaxID=6313 RepID=A0A0K0DP57_ANGCA